MLFVLVALGKNTKTVVVEFHSYELINNGRKKI